MEELAENVWSGVKDLSSSVSIRARIVSDSMASNMNRLNQYLEDTDLQEEFLKGLERITSRRRSYSVHSEPVTRTVSEPKSSSQTFTPSRRMSTMFSNSRLYLMGGMVCSPAITRRRNTCIPLSMHEGDYKKQAASRHSTTTTSCGESQTDISHMTSGGHTSDTSGGHTSDTLGYHTSESVSSLNPTIVECPVNTEDANTQGKLFISTEYSTDGNKLHVYVTQHGNISRMDHGQNFQLSFSYILDGVVSKRRRKKLKMNRYTNEFYKDYKYSVRFESHSRMINSGVLVQVRLKSANFWSRKKTIKTETIELHNVEKSPVKKMEKLFF